MNDDPYPLGTSLLTAPAVTRVNATLRLGRLMSFLVDSTQSTTSTTNNNNNRTLENEYWISLEVATYLAVQDFNKRQSMLVPTLQDRIASCDLMLTLQMRDTEFSPIVAVRQYQKGILDDTTNSSQQQQQQPTTMAIIGSIRSTVTASLATISGTQGIPQVSGLATSEALDDKSSFPFFARTIPNDSSGAIATCAFFHSLSVHRFAVLYVNDFYGVSYYFDLLQVAKQYHQEIVSASYYENDDASLQNAIQLLHISGLRYFVGIVGFRDPERTLLALHNQGLLGVPGYTWFFSESVSDVVISTNEFFERYPELTQPLVGSGFVLPQPPADKNAILQQELDQFASNTILVKDYIQNHAEPDIFPNNFQFHHPVASMGALLFYDSVMALGIAACEMEQQDLFTGPQLYQKLLSTSFDGASGQVSFVNETGTRVANQVNYGIINLVRNNINNNNNNLISTQQGGQQQHQQASNDASVIAFNTANVNITDATIQIIRPFVFSDGTTIPPPLAASVKEDLNLIPQVEIWIMFTVVALVALMSIACGIWTILNRNQKAVRVSQPTFLFCLCIGTFLISISATFQAFQEPMSPNTLDLACNIYPWFVCIGFTTAYSALFSKTWRINRVYQSAQQCRRVTVTIRHVIWPFAVLFFANTIVLTAWMMVDPLNWRRVPISYDVNGQVTASYGTCFHFDDVELTFFVLVLLLNLTALLIANYQSFQARNLPTEYNETFYVALTNAILLEASILGTPVIMLVREQPGALFLVRAILLITCSLAVLLPIFVPKMMAMDGKRGRRYMLGTNDGNNTTNNGGRMESPRRTVSSNPVIRGPINRRETV